MYVCMYVCMYVSMYVCMYVHIPIIKRFNAVKSNWSLLNTIGYHIITENCHFTLFLILLGLSSFPMHGASTLSAALV